MDLHKIGFKVFAEEGSTVKLVEFIPVFHRWIQKKALDNLLIDVADYSHVPAGPGIVLVAHEGNYAIDETGDRRGIVYYSKHELDGNFSVRLASVCRHALNACKLMQEEEQFNGRLNFPGKELQLFANDRLQAPNTDETWARLEPELQGFFKTLFNSTDFSIKRETDSKGRFQVNIMPAQPVAIDTLLKRIAI
jgi:hypothetical protein